MNLRTFFAFLAGALFVRPAKALTTDSGARWIPIQINTPTGPVSLLIWAKLPSDNQQQKGKTI